ncbi:MAG: zinc finger Ran-binding domain-containing family 2 protein [Lachnospiraceae bacterium]|nr:zinc finger Ran-binding domain-containing family 2 protein [Lachnospiraceae bacterium]
MSMERESVWICPECSSANSADAAECYVCGARRPEKAVPDPIGAKTEPVIILDAGDLPSDGKTGTEKLPSTEMLTQVWSFCFSEFRVKLESCMSGLKLLSFAGTLIGFGLPILAFVCYLIFDLKLFSGFGFGVLMLMVHALTIAVYIWYESVPADQQVYLFDVTRMRLFSHYDTFAKLEEERQKLLGEAAKAGVREFEISLGKTFAPLLFSGMIHGMMGFAEARGALLIIFFSYVTLFLLSKGIRIEDAFSSVTFRKWRNYLWSTADRWKRGGYLLPDSLFCPVLYQQAFADSYETGRERIQRDMAFTVIASIFLCTYGLFKYFGF